MGLGGTDLAGEAAAAMAACSICLDAVIVGGDRATARLQCGHEFHLDCIGSAFNAKGVMQCPNCRNVEKGNWLYGNGSCSLSDLTVPEWAHDEDLYDLSYSEMPLVHWCPFGRLARVASSFDADVDEWTYAYLDIPNGEGDPSPAIAFQEPLGHHGIFTEHPSSSAAQPYLAFQPHQPPSTSNSHVFSGNLLEGPAYRHHWCQVPPAEVQSHALTAIDLPYDDAWEHHAPIYSTHGSHSSNADQVPVSSATIRASRLDSDGLQRAGHFVHPFMPGHSSRATRQFVSSSSIPPYVGASEAQAHVLEHHQHHNSTGMHGIRRPGSTRRVASIGTASPSPSDHTGYYYLFPPTQPPNRSFQDVENTEGNRFYAWERDQFAPFPSVRVDRESGWWGPFPQSAAPSDPNSRMGFWHWPGSERSSAEDRPEGSYRPVDAQMRAFR